MPRAIIISSYVAGSIPGSLASKVCQDHTCITAEEITAHRLGDGQAKSLGEPCVIAGEFSSSVLTNIKADSSCLVLWEEGQDYDAVPNLRDAEYTKLTTRMKYSNNSVTALSVENQTRRQMVAFLIQSCRNRELDRLRQSDENRGVFRALAVPNEKVGFYDKDVPMLVMNWMDLSNPVGGGTEDGTT